MAETGNEQESGFEARLQRLEAGMRSPAAKRVLGLLCAGAVAFLGALILGEYEFKGSLPWIAGPLFGLVLGEVVVTVGRARDLFTAGAVAAMAFVGIVWAGWIDSSQGVEPVHSMVWVAAGLAAAVGYVRTAGIRSPQR